MRYTPKGIVSHEVHPEGHRERRCPTYRGIFGITLVSKNGEGKCGWVGWCTLRHELVFPSLQTLEGLHVVAKAQGKTVNELPSHVFLKHEARSSKHPRQHPAFSFLLWIIQPPRLTLLLVLSNTRMQPSDPL